MGSPRVRLFFSTKDGLGRLRRGPRGLGSKASRRERGPRPPDPDPDPDPAPDPGPDPGPDPPGPGPDPDPDPESARLPRAPRSRS